MAATYVPISEDIANDKMKLSVEAVKHVRSHWNFITLESELTFFPLLVRKRFRWIENGAWQQLDALYPTPLRRLANRAFDFIPPTGGLQILRLYKGQGRVDRRSRMGSTSENRDVDGTCTRQSSNWGNVSRAEVDWTKVGWGLALKITGNDDSQPNRIASSRGIEMRTVATRSTMGIVRIMLWRAVDWGWSFKSLSNLVGGTRNALSMTSWAPSVWVWASLYQGNLQDQLPSTSGTSVCCVCAFWEHEPVTFWPASTLSCTARLCQLPAVPARVDWYTDLSKTLWNQTIGKEGAL